MKTLLTYIFAAVLLVGGISAVSNVQSGPSFASWTKFLRSYDSSYGVKMTAGMEDQDTVLLKFENYTPTSGAYYGTAVPYSATVNVNGLLCPITISSSGVIYAHMSSSLFDFGGGMNSLKIEVFDANNQRIFFEEYTDMKFL